MNAATIRLLVILILVTPSCKKNLVARPQSEDAKNAAKITQLLDGGTSPNEYFGNKPMLSVAASGGSAEVVALLLKRGADVKQRGRLTGRTALFDAAKREELEIATLLLDAGADPQAQNHAGETALQVAALAQRSAMVRLLISRGADPMSRNKKGQTVAEAVEGQTTPEILRLLRPL